MKDVPSIIYTITDLEQARIATERALAAMRFAEQREEKTAAAAAEKKEASVKAAGVAAKSKAEADDKRMAAAVALRHERERYPGGKQKNNPFAQTWAARIAELGLTERKARDLLQLSGYKDSLPDADGNTSGNSTKDTSTSDPCGADEEADEEVDDGDGNTDDGDGNTDDAATQDPKTDRSGGRGKPEWLMRALVRDYSMAGDMVCDPLSGWGSTLRAALDEGRRAIGSEIDPVIAAAAGTLPIHVGPWSTALAHVVEVDAIITDPPYSARTHEASRKFGNARADGSPLDGLGPEYAAWTRAHVFEFVRYWAPRCRGWMVALTDHNLIHDWQDAYEEQDRYSFAPVVCVIRGMTVRLCGDGPSSSAIYAMVSRPREYSRWRTLSGHYVGSRERLELGNEVAA